ncbi:MAG: T9SS type A sorting domain-containing protein [bacterium]|nr:T9SS type A sorting domain-containing protein [bacterium]
MRSKLLVLVLATAVLSVLPASADWQTATVGLGNSIQSVAVDPVKNRIFTANTLSGTVTVVNGKTNEVQTWTAGTQPTCLAVNPITGKLYVSINGSSTNDTVVVFDTLGNSLKKLPVKKEPTSMVIDVDNDRLYVANSGSDTISIFASDTLWFSYPVNNAPYSLTLNPVNHALFIRYTGSDTISTFNPGQYSIMHFRSGLGAQDITVNAAANMAYVANTSEDSVAVYDCSGIMPAFVKKIKVGDGPVRLVSDPGAKMVYVANMTGGYVTAINCSTNTAVLNVPVGSSPVNMAINPVTGKLYVGNNNVLNSLSIVDWRNGGTLETVALSHPARLVALNPVTNKIYVTYEAGNPDSLAVIDGSDYDNTKVTAKMYTCAAAVNPVTGDAFFVNYGSDTVTVIKSTGVIASIAVGDEPLAVAANPLTNKIFVCNYGSKSVSVIDGATYTLERTIEVDSLPYSIAVNPLTNYIYVGSWLASGSRIKVIDGKDWDTSSVQAGQKHSALAVNPATNRIYVCNYGSNTVSVIDGAHHALLAAVDAGTNPYSIAVNTVTNKIYVVNGSSNNVTVINGADNTAATVAAGAAPRWVAVNSANNKAYVTNFDAGTVTEIDGATNGTSTITVGANPAGIGADPVTGKVFVANNGSASLGVIDCASGRMITTVATDGYPGQVTVNPVNGKVYATCANPSGSITIVDQTVEQDTKVASYDIIHIVSGSAYSYIATSGTANFPGRAVNRWSPSKTKLQKSLFRLTTFGRDWHFADSPVTGDSISWSLSLSSWSSDSFIWGENILSYCAIDEQAAATNNLGVGTPFAGNNVSKPVYRIDYAAPTIAWWDSLADDNDSLNGYGPYTVRAVITDFSGVDYAKLYYQMSGKSWPSVTMTRASADTFIAELPAQTMTAGDTAVMSYFIGTSDHANSLNNSSNTISSNTRSFRLRNLTGVEGNPSDPALPRTFALQAACPNPSRGQTVIKYQLPKASNVQLQVYNVAGQLVKTVNEGQKPAGYHRIDLNSAQLSNGIYFYRLHAGEFSATKKLVVLK